MAIEIEGMSLEKAFLFLVWACQQESINMEITYNAGRYIEGKDIEEHNLTGDPSLVKQGPAGYTINVSGVGYVDDKGDELLYGDVAVLTKAFYNLFTMAMEEKNGKAGSKNGGNPEHVEGSEGDSGASEPLSEGTGEVAGAEGETHPLRGSD